MYVITYLSVQGDEFHLLSESLLGAFTELQTKDDFNNEIKIPGYFLFTYDGDANYRTTR